MRKREITNECIKLYKKNLSIYQICNIIDASYGTVKSVLIKNKVKLRQKYVKHSSNNDFFKKIDTEEKAYFLGLFAADGYNCIDKGYIELGLQINDKEIIEKFKTAICFIGPIRTKQSKNKKCKKICSIHVTNKEICESLESLGCLQNKTLTLKFPTPDQVPDHLIHHFIRGYFDGDGCVHINKYNQAVINIIGTLDFCNTLNELMSRRCNFPIYKINIDKRSHNIGSYQLNGTKRVLNFYNFLYNKSTIFLTRKNQIFTDYFKSKEKEINKIKTSKYIGVRFDKKKNKFVASFWDSKVNSPKFLGYFKCETEAAKFRDNFIIQNIKDYELNKRIIMNF